MHLLERFASVMTKNRMAASRYWTFREFPIYLLHTYTHTQSFSQLLLLCADLGDFIVITGGYTIGRAHPPFGCDMVL